MFMEAYLGKICTRHQMITILDSQEQDGEQGRLLTLSPELLDQKDVKEFFFIFLLT